jgi:tetratricopeptide (TPR) repeat protein
MTLMLTGCGEPDASRGGPVAGGKASEAAPQHQEEAAAALPPEVAATDGPLNRQSSIDDRQSASAIPIPSLNQPLSRIFNLLRSRPPQIHVARMLLEDYLEQHPEDGHAHFVMGVTFDLEHRYAQALPHYERALALVPPPGYPPIFSFQGWAHYWLGELEAARQSFEAFLQMRPDEPDALFALGVIALDEHDLDEAQRKFERGIAVVQDENSVLLAKIHARLSEVHEQRGGEGDLERAREHLQTAVDLNPDAYEAMYKLHRVLVRLGRSEEAHAMHERYLEVRERVRPTGAGFQDAAGDRK